MCSRASALVDDSGSERDDVDSQPTTKEGIRSPTRASRYRLHLTNLERLPSLPVANGGPVLAYGVDRRVQLPRRFALRVDLCPRDVYDFVADAQHLMRRRDVGMRMGRPDGPAYFDPLQIFDAEQHQFVDQLLPRHGALIQCLVRRAVPPGDFLDRSQSFRVHGGHDRWHVRYRRF